MCGIAAFFCRESVPDTIIIHKMLQWCEKRGVDGVGISVVRRDCDKWVEISILRSTSSYSNLGDDVKDMILNYDYCVGDVILMICRAQPETESKTTLDNMQPIVGGGCVLIHNGAVSQKQVKEAQFRSHYMMTTDIDSEVIISEYTRLGRNIKSTQESLSGGFAYIMVDLLKGQMYLVNDFKPLSIGYVKGTGFMVASDNNCLREVVEQITDCKRDGTNIWEYYYAHPQRGNTIRGIDLDSGFEMVTSFNPRFITNTWDSSTPTNKEELCVVCCSGGLDSSLTLAVLKYAGYKNIIACHFKYGHRGQECEEYAIKNVCDKLDIPLKIFDIENIMGSIDNFSMLTDANSKIITGTDEGLKTVSAWVCNRNGLFLSIMAATAEAETIKNNYEKVYILGGMLQLTESGHYPDNSEYFMSSFLEHVKYSTLIGNRFKPLYCLSNIMKSEQWILIDHLKLHDMIKHTVSCDRPKMINGIPHNCSKDGKPACGSGALSWWAASMVGSTDNRLFYEVDDDDYQLFEPSHMKNIIKKDTDILNIIDRILLPDDKKDNLRKYITK
jgi:7-cyano-7-deazaguanine synthase in queuosine biosynthesis